MCVNQRGRQEMGYDVEEVKDEKKFHKGGDVQ